MRWLPQLADFRDAMRSANGTENPIEKLQRLAHIANHALDFVQTTRLDKTVQSLVAESEQNHSHFVRVKMGILAESTADHLVPAIRVAGIRRGVLIETYLAPFAQVTQEILSSSSGLRDFDPDIVLIAPRGVDAFSELPVATTGADMAAAVDRRVEELGQLWKVLRDEIGATVIQQTFLDSSEPLFGNLDVGVAGAPRCVLAHANSRLAESCRSHETIVLDLDAAVRRQGLDYWFDLTRWYQAKVEISFRAAPHYGDLVARTVAASLGRSKKCLVLDLDDTLWGGVIGDDGLDGIEIGNGSAVGEAHLALQRYVLQLKERGVVLAVCSKNEQATAESAFRDHPDMLLRMDDIAVFVANWTDKAQNLRAIAERLNIGLDSLVFLDDNPVERARVREALPMIAVPELPDDPALFARYLADAGHFEAVAFTAEDRQRAMQYAANVKRESLQHSAADMSSFLKGLDMRLEFGPIRPVDRARSVQLIGKTNQFRTTQRRFTAEAFAHFIEAPSTVSLRFRLKDRFGDNGLVSVVLLEASEDSELLEIVSWVMSCRVFGRQLEDEIANIVVEAAKDRGARIVSGSFEPTDRNRVVYDLYRNLGFTNHASSDHVPEASRWALAVADYAPRKTFIRRETYDAVE